MVMKMALNLAVSSRHEKRMRYEDGVGMNPFDALHDDILIVILSKLSASAESPADLLAVMSSCKRMNKLAMEPIVLRNASRHAITVYATSWCDQAHNFVSHCAEAGNLDACYMLGMIEFYCLGHYGRGTDLLARAAQASHVEALYSLSIISFTDSGNTNMPHCYHGLGHPVELCAKSAKLGHRDAITEIGYCLWNFSHIPNVHHWVNSLYTNEEEIEGDEMELDGDLDGSRIDMQFGTQAHPVNQFLVEWWWLASAKSMSKSDGLQTCSRLCGRRETMTNEFYRCNCNKKFYCSHACRVAHWETEHYATCEIIVVE